MKLYVSLKVEKFPCLSFVDQIRPVLGQNNLRDKRNDKIVIFSILSRYPDITR